MQLHQIELVPGESIRVGTKIVTLVAVHGSVAELHVDENDGGGSFDDPACLLDSWLEPAFA